LTGVGEVNESIFREMIAVAKEASRQSYSPYSNFRVGAAILAEDGQIFSGCNVENASYGLTICAERNAVFQMAAKGRRKILMVVIYTPTEIPAAPCGACRQVINEFGAEALVVSVCDTEQILRKRISELLPEAFGPGNLSS
jgi:cytidine deaminase